MKNYTPFPVYTLNLNAIQLSFGRLGKAIEDRSFIEAAHFATAAIDQIERSMLANALYHRAYAFGMQGKFDAATKDAEHLIRLDPTMVAGYICLGNLYTMQGKSLNAIDAYGKGLQNVPPTESNLTLLLDEKKCAIEQYSKHIDFIASLPVEVVYCIFDELPKQSLSACLEVSGLWRKRLLECPMIWNDLEKDDNADDSNITSALPHIARYVEYLLICTENRRVWDQYLINMRDGHFTKIKELYITELSTKHIINTAPVSTLTAFWQIRNTLTVLHLDFDADPVTIMTIADVLFVCNNLKELEYKLDSPLLFNLGDLTILQHSTLILESLQLQAKSGIGSNLESLLKKCQRLRRLVLDGCTDTVLEVINTHCPYLQLFGYNADDQVRDLDQLHEPCGLQALCSTSQLEAIPVETLMVLLMSNMTTLDTVYADICPENDVLDGTPYAELKLPKLKALKYWSDDNGDNIERVILQSISNCTALTHFEAVNTTIVSEVVDTLLTLPPVRTLTLADTDENIDAHAKLIRLFEKYSAFSNTLPCLGTVCLRFCSSVNDGVLAALGQIQSLRNITLSGLSNVTTNGLNMFLARLGSDVLGLALASMDCIADSHLVTIGAMQGITEVHLENLPNISNYGVIYMSDNSKRLRSILIKGCHWVTEQAVEHVRWKVDIDFDEAPTLA